MEKTSQVIREIIATVPLSEQDAQFDLLLQIKPRSVLERILSASTTLHAPNNGSAMPNQHAQPLVKQTDQNPNAFEKKVVDMLTNQNPNWVVCWKLKTTSPIVKRIAAKFGIVPYCIKRKVDVGMRDEMFELNEQGLDYYHIAEKVGSSPQTVQRVLNYLHPISQNMKPRKKKKKLQKAI